MPLKQGSSLGPYEIIAPLGAGGMGEVYRARDPRLNRDVAIKVLPASYSADPERLRRFEQEAKAAGLLNHPNITAVYDIGTREEAPYVVHELLEGETLRSALAAGRLSLRRTMDYSIQIAQGLAAAHEKGIVHRDLKPENVFITREGRIKILDFGLAKLTRPERPSDSSTEIATQTAGTDPGTVMGTVGYMSPEQVRGQPVDGRSDIFAFGTILYEMLSGRRAFHGDTAADTMTAILKEDPPDLSMTNQNIPPGLERIVHHCLEKAPQRRFHSAHDLAFDLEAVSGVPTTSGAVPAAPGRRRRSLAGPALAAGLVLVAAVIVAAFLRGGGGPPAPTFTRLTYRRGFIGNARFAPDGQTILYSADWDGAPSRIFSTRPEGREATALPLPSASLLSVSSRGEMAILLDLKIDYNLYFRVGTLAVVPLAGGSPREIARDVRLADWGPDGKDLAIVRGAGGRQRLEYPPGRVLHESPAWIVSMRVSPRGDRIAFFEGLPFNGYLLSVIGSDRRKTVLGPVRPDFWASDWSPDGDEIWLPESGSSVAAETPLVAVNLSGRQRLLERGPFTADLDDVTRDGRALMTLFDQEEWTRGQLSGQTMESRLVNRTDLRLVDLSQDGTVLVLRDTLVQGAPGVWIARANDAPPIRLGDGVSHGISPDGAWVLASQHGRLLALPTAAGAPRPVSEGFFEAIRYASWFRDLKRVLVWGQTIGGQTGIFVVDPDAREPRRIAPEGYELVSGGNALSPDGHLVVARSPENQMMLCPVEGGQPRPVPGLTGLFVPVQWSADGRGFFVFRLNEIPARVERIDLESGRATLWKELTPPDLAGVTIRSFAMTPDGKSYAYAYQQYLSTLYLVENLESWRRPGLWSRLLGRGK